MKAIDKILSTCAVFAIAVIAFNASATTLIPIQPLGEYFKSSLQIAAADGSDVDLRPSLSVPVEHQGQSAELFANYTIAGSDVIGVKTSAGVDVFKGMVQPYKTVNLSATQQFDLYQGPLPEKLTVYYGYRLNGKIYSNGLTITRSATAQSLQDLVDGTMVAAPSAINGGIPGMILAVNLPGEGMWIGSSGVSDIDAQTPMSEMVNGQFRIGSITKTFTGMTILQLLQEGKLGIDDVIEKYLPGVIPTNANTITIRHLLTHTSGIFNFTNTVAWLTDYLLNPTRTWTPEELIEVAFAESQSLSTPGETFHYANTNYVILGMVIEKVTGNSWESEVEKRFIEPLHLTNTKIPRTGDSTIAEPYIHGYFNLFEDSEGAVGEDTLIRRGAFDPSFMDASGNMLSTVPDLIRWMTAIQSGELIDLDHEHAQQDWFIAESIFGTVEMGLGIIRTPSFDLVGHRGQVKGFDSSMQYDWDGVGTMVAVINRSLASGSVDDVILFNAANLVNGRDLGFGQSQTATAKTRVNGMPCGVCEY